jgi:hypothetical protein
MCFLLEAHFLCPQIKISAWSNLKDGLTMRIPFGEPSGIRTPDTLIKSQVLYRLS